MPPLYEVALANVFSNDASQLQIVRLHGFVDLVRLGAHLFIFLDVHDLQTGFASLLVSCQDE